MDEGREGDRREDIRQLHLAPSTLFSVAAFSHVQLRALCFPHEQVALLAQTQAESERLQQVVGRVDTILRRCLGVCFDVDGQLGGILTSKVICGSSEVKNLVFGGWREKLEEQREFFNKKQNCLQCVRSHWLIRWTLSRFWQH